MGTGLQGLVVHGLTHGLSDEVAGAAAVVADGLVSAFSDHPFDAAESFASGRDMARADRDAERERRPNIALIAEMVGGLAGLRPAGIGPAAGITTGAAVAAPRSAAVRAGAALGAGAGAGAVAGFGTAEGGTEQRLEGARMGALAGGALSVLAPIGGAIWRLGRGLAGRGGSFAERESQRQILRALARDDIEPDQLVRRVREAGQTGQPLALADLGRNTQRLGRAVETVPGRGGARAVDFLDERQFGQGSRLVQQVNRVLSGEDAGAALIRLEAQRAAEAAPLYQAAYARAPFDASEFGGLINRPIFSQAYERARRIMAIEGVEIPPLNTRQQPLQIDTRTIDYVKRGIDDLIAPHRDPTTGRITNETGRALVSFRRELLETADRLNPDFAKARLVYSSHSDLVDALEDGRRFMAGDLEAMSRQFKQLSLAEQDAFRIGAAQRLRNDIMRAPDTSNAAARLINKEDIRRRLQRILSPDDFENLQEFARNESRMAQTRGIVAGGSPTGRITAEQDDAVLELAETALDLLSGGSALRAAGAGLGAIGRRSTGLNEEVATGIGRRIFSSDPARNLAVANELQGAAASPGVGRDATFNRLMSALAALGFVGGGVTDPTGQ